MEVHSSRSGQSEAEAATASATCVSSSPYFSERIQSLIERRDDFPSKVEFEIESSKPSWTEVSNCDSDVEHLPNSVVLENLKEHPVWGPFFRRRPYELEIGEKIAEGGQAEIFEASGTNAFDASRDGGSDWNTRWRGKDIVVKVFKEGFPLQDLQQLWPPGMASAALPYRYFSRQNRTRLRNLYGLCWAIGAQLLEDGRFAFVFDRHWGDLRKLIDGRMLKSNGTPPFSLMDTHLILSNIARGMAELHGIGLLHRDLKAGNILMTPSNDYPAYIADFESSVGVVGTGFWRAPEVLWALKSRSLKAETFTQQSDVYSYGMTCYEVITGRVPFEGHSLSDYDVVLRGERPVLPDTTDSRLKALLRKCWHEDPLQRPSFNEIIRDFETMAG